MMQQCIKCKETKDESKFCDFIAVTLEGKKPKKRIVCYACNYINVKRIKYFHSWNDEEKMERLKEKFENQVIRQEGCWDWKGFIRGDGYVRVRHGGDRKSIGGHIASYMIHHNLLDLDGSCVLHTCDNRKCTNPDHLFLGNYADNARDMAKKKRTPSIKLTVEKVKMIKHMLENKVPATYISERYKVHRRTIDDIKHNRTWSYI